MAARGLELDLQDPWLCPFALYSKLDWTHDGVKGGASCVRREACVVETTGRFDSLCSHLHLGIGMRLNKGAERYCNQHGGYIDPAHDAMQLSKTSAKPGGKPHRAEKEGDCAQHTVYQEPPLERQRPGEVIVLAALLNIR